MNWKVLLATVVIFACGVITGAMISGHNPTAIAAPATSQAEKSKNPPLHLQKVELLHRMEKHLDLSADQKERIEKIMRESQERTKTLWDQIAPQMAEEMRKFREDIRKELSPEQQTKFEALLKQRPSRRGDEPARRHPTNAKPATAEQSTNK